MSEISKGEEHRFFPSFFPRFLALVLVAGVLFPSPCAAQESAKDRLSAFDRLAEEAALLNQRGQSDKVIVLLEPRRKDPKNDSALFFNELGIAYRRTGKLSDAIGAYQEALSRDPQNPVIMNNLGSVYIQQKDYAKGVEQYQKVLQSNPRFKEAHSNLGLAYYRMGKYREALSEMETVLRLDPQHPEAKKLRDEIRGKINVKK